MFSESYLRVNTNVEMIAYVFIALLIPFAKIVLGALTSAYFYNVYIGSWWAGASTAILCVVTPVTFPSMIALLFGLLFSIISVALCAIATTLDGMTAEYFGRTVKDCNFPDHEGIPCYCEETKSAFNSAFRSVGEIDCSNAFTRNPNYLIANTALSIACLVVSALLFLSLLFGVLNMIFSAACCDKPPDDRYA